MFDFKNKIAIVTGATSGIGKTVAIELANRGAFVVAIGRDEERGSAIVHEIGNERCQFFKVDVANSEDVKILVKKILEEHTKVDILVNNAGITKDQLLIKMTEKEWDEVMAINVKSCYNFCHALMRPMMKARFGKIVNMSSVVALSGNPGQVNYCASKAAMIGFTKALAKEVASRGINVNCIAPGFVISQMTEVLTQEQTNGILSRIPMGRMGDTQEIAYAVLFLCSEMSNYITGQVLTVDGGMV